MAAVEAPRRTRSALLIAGGNYSDPGLASLRAPTGDVAGLAEVLADPAIGGFEVDQLVDQPTDVIKKRIEDFFRESARNDLLLFYFSGHGVLAQNRRFYFATASTELQWVRTTAIEDRFVNEVMEGSRARSIVVVLDCCHSGAFGKGLVPKSALSVDVEHRFDGHGRVTLTASSELEYAFEESDPATGINSLEPQAPGSLFTRSVIEGLRSGEADTDEDGAISVDDLFDYVRHRVRERSVHQTPRMSGDVSGDIVIARSTRRLPLPPDLEAAVRSNLAGIRAGAVSELAALMGTGASATAATARAALERLADDDSRTVAAAARAALGAPPAPPAQEEAASPPGDRRPDGTTPVETPVIDTPPAAPWWRRRPIALAGAGAAVATAAAVAAILLAGGGDERGGPPAAYDFDGDGAQEIVLGAAGGSPAGGPERAGVVLIHPGPDEGEAEPIPAEAAGLAGARGGDRYGAAIAGADFDGDGRADLAIGAPGRDIVLLLYGSADEPLGRRGTPLRVSHLADPPQAGAFGFALAAGDVDRDGFADLIVGTPGLPHERRNDVPGAVHVFLGGAGGLSSERARRIEPPAEDEVGFGRFLELGDIDHDGHMDLVEGTMGEPEYGNLGHGTFCRGTPDGPTSCSRLPDSSGWGTSSLAVGDINGDRFPDIVQGDQEPYDGSTTQPGEVRIWVGSDDGVQAEPIILTEEIVGLDPSDQAEFGHAVEAGDVNHDGLADVVIGARYWSEAGAVVVVHGQRSAERRPDVAVLGHDAAKGAGFGETLALLHLDGDDRLDLAVGVASVPTLDDAVVIFPGSPGGLGSERSLGGMAELATTDRSPLRIGR